MTGLDRLKEAIILSGNNRQMANSKAVAVCWEILTHDNEKYATTQYEYEERIRELQEKYNHLNDEFQRLKIARNNLDIELLKTREEIESIKENEWQREVEYVERFNASLLECETPEGRDATRKCQMFINSIDVDSKYDNTAKIISLGAILSNGSIAPVDELRKINPKLFKDNHGRVWTKEKERPRCLNG